MAPRRRPSRPSQASRMAAAVEAMVEMGFEDKLVRQKVNRLLKEDLYGEEGWRFIEEASYSVLIDALAPDQTNGDENENASLEKSKGRNYAETDGPSSSKVASPKKSSCGKDTRTSGAGPLSKEVSPQTDTRGVDTETSGAGHSLSKVLFVENNPSGGSVVETSEPLSSSSRKVIILPCSNVEVVNNTVRSKDDLDSSSHNKPLDSASPTQLPDANNFLLLTEGDSQGQQGTLVAHSARQLDTLPTRRRRPYHGWVGRNDDDDFVIQAPAPLSEVLQKVFILNVDSGKRKRKRRWDVQPEDM